MKNKEGEKAGRNEAERKIYSFRLIINFMVEGSRNRKKIALF